MWRCQPMLQVTSFLRCSMLHWKWCFDTIVLVYDLSSVAHVAPHQKCHWAICWCPGDVTLYTTDLCEQLSHKVPGPRPCIPSPAGSLVGASTQQWPVLGMASAPGSRPGQVESRQIPEDTGRVSVRLVNLCWLDSTPASSDQDSYRVNIFYCQAPRPQTPKPQTQKPKTKGPWADTKISWANNNHPTPPPTFKHEGGIPQ